ncbi:MAG TPA: porin [Burkholderiaceae bacterium]|nr:porin [Burkholderiaceae bacterium]
MIVMLTNSAPLLYRTCNVSLSDTHGFFTKPFSMRDKTMKKSLIALAALSTLAGTAFAQTAITIYGVVDAGIVYDNSSARNWKLDSGNQSGSRIGFKGSEDLGGGMSAIFNLENGFNSDNGTLGQPTPTNASRLFGRQAWVGLKAGFGSVKLGRQLSPLYVAMDQIDPFRIGLAGNAQRAFGYGLYNTDPFLRIDNAISFSVPDMSGITGSVIYGFGEQAGAFANGRTAGLGLGYANGPINVQFAYQDSNTITLTGVSSAGATTATSLSNAFGTSADLRTLLVGGYYDFGVAKAHLAYADTHVDTAATSTKDRNWMLGISAPLGGAGTVMASWNRNDIRDIASGKSNQYAIGYSHALSKRTNLYTSIGYTKNDSNVNLNAAGNGQSDRLFNVGVRHLF